MVGKTEEKEASDGRCYAKRYNAGIVSATLLRQIQDHVGEQEHNHGSRRGCHLKCQDNGQRGFAVKRAYRPYPAAMKIGVVDDGQEVCGVQERRSEK